MTVFKNMTLHRIHLSKELEDSGVKVLEPDEFGVDRKKLFIAIRKIENGEITLKQEQHRIIAEITPFIEKGDNIIVAGHPAVVLSVAVVCSIKKAKCFSPILNKENEVIRFEELIFDDRILDREFRYDIEHNTTRRKQ